MKSSSFTCRTPLLPKQRCEPVRPCISICNVHGAVEPSRKHTFPSGEAIHNTQTPRVCTHRAMATGKKTSNSFRLTGCGLSFLLTVPKARHPKANLVPTSACAAKDATFNRRHRRHHHESPMSSQHGGRLSSVGVLESELPRTSVSEKSIGNCEMAVRHKLYHTRHEGSLEESTVGGLRQRSPVVCPEASHFNSGTTMKASGTKLAREKRSQHRDAKTPDILATRRRQHQHFQEVVHRLERCMVRVTYTRRDCEAMTPQALVEELSRVHGNVAHHKRQEKGTRRTQTKHCLCRTVEPEVLDFLIASTPLQETGRTSQWLSNF